MSNEMPKTFAAIRNHLKVEDISYAPWESYIENRKEIGPIYWVYLDGWCSGQQGYHIINGSNIAEVRQQLKESKSCKCTMCGGVIE